jgi:hypothetical protein
MMCFLLTREVERDLALIKSPAAGLKRATAVSRHFIFYIHWCSVGQTGVCVPVAHMDVA